MIKLNKEARQETLQIIKEFNDGEFNLLEFVRKVLFICGIDEDVEKQETGYNPFCDDPECLSCNGIGADGHHY